MRRRLALLLLLGLLLPPREAHLSQVHYQPVSLKQVIERSDLVLIVKMAKPSQRQIPIPIGKDNKNQEAPAFVRVQTRCEVQRALTAAGAELVGKTIEIDGANWQDTLAMHKIYYLEGIGESPIYERYQPADPADAQAREAEPKDAPFIVFLRREAQDGKTGFAFVVEGAVERLKNRAAIEELLRRLRKP
jgi:hypothetical protein